MSAAERIDERAPQELAPLELALQDLADLKRAVALLKGRSFAVRVSQQLGRGAAGLSAMAPAGARSVVLRAAEGALQFAMRRAVRKVGRGRAAAGQVGRYWFASGVSGALGGAFGIFGSVAELPVSTAILMRSIAAIAREEGEDLSDPGAPLACLEVFALDGGGADATIDSSYFAIRAALARSVSEAARHLAQKRAIDGAAPALVRLISMVAPRFGVVVGEKFVAQAVPLVGAGFGAAINLAFAGHFQSLARGHFIMRRLERRYGADAVRMAAERVG